MEVVAAVGLVSNILQFLEFSAKLLSGSREIRTSASGTTAEFESLEHMCQFVGELSAGLIPPLSPEELSALPPRERPIKEEITLARLAIRCKEASTNLHHDLKKLHIEALSRGRVASVRQAAKNWLSRTRIKSLQKTVDDSRKELALCLQAVTT